MKKFMTKVSAKALPPAPGGSGGSGGATPENAGRDPDFDRCSALFHTHYDRLQKFDVSLKEFERSMSAILKAEYGVVEQFANASAHSEMPDLNESLRQLAGEIQALESLRVELVDDIQRRIREPLKRYMDQYSTMDRRVKERNKRAKELETYRKELDRAQNAQPRDEMKIKVARVKVEHAEPIFANFNREVLQDLQNLSFDLPNFLTPMFACWAMIQHRFHGIVKSKWDRALETVSHVGPDDHLGLPIVITPQEHSAINETTQTGQY